MPRLRHVLAALACATVGLLPGRVAAQPVPLDTVLARAALYVAAFAERFSNVVSEERYEQSWTGQGGRSIGHRDLTSEFLLVKVTEGVGWVSYRDVIEVDGKAVRDRDERLAKLFLGAPGTAAEQAAAITFESARYNISPVRRTVNEPLLALRFLHTQFQGRFTYKFYQQDKAAGADVWIVEYTERARPTLVRGTNNRNLPSHGRYWINLENGAVLRSELQLEDVYALTRLSTSFRWDERFGINVPAQMSESYVLGGGSSSSGTRVTGTATYGGFRSFVVKSEETIDLPR